MLANACNTVRYFITSIFTLPHIPRRFTVMTFLPYHALDSYTRLFVCCFTSYPHHRQFIDLRHIGHTIHLWTAFDFSLAAKTTASLCRLHRASDNRRLRTYASRSISVDASGRYPLISSIEISVLQGFGLHSSFDLCLTFSVRNASHGCRCRSPPAD